MKLDFKKLMKKLKVQDYDLKSILENYADDRFSNRRKIPTKNNHYVGIEVECFGDVAESELKLLLMNYDLEDYVQVSEDGSIDTYGAYSNEYELRILLPQNQMTTIFPRLQKFFTAAGLHANDTCGLHVHLDMRNRDKDTCAKRLNKFKDVLFSLVEPDRWDNDFCRYESNPNDRFQAINMLSYISHKTIEVRLHHGTTDMKEVQKWVQLLVKIITPGTQPKEMTKKGLMGWSRLSKPLKTYIKKNMNEGWWKEKQTRGLCA